MSNSYNVLILGASYGSLLGTKLLMAGHSVTLVCTSATAQLINNEGTEVRLPVRGRDDLVSVKSKSLETALRAATPDKINPSDYDLVVLGMQEPQYGADGVRQLLDAIAKARVPSMAIMNMPPLPYLARLPGVDPVQLEHCYTEPEVWANFEPGLLTLASPDPQAFRPPEEGKNVLQVSLPTNFKVAKFESSNHTRMLQQIQSGIENISWQLDDGSSTELPVKLKVFDSLYVPLAKWSMLMTGNYRCIMKNDIRSIRDAVHTDLAASKDVYQWVADLCVKLGADPGDMVPFDKYANAAKGLAKPSSAARALFGGSTNIERVDRLVHSIASQFDMSHDAVDDAVGFVDAQLAVNRVEAKAS